MTPSEDLFELGSLPKGRNRGTGLNNVKEILDKYENIILETEMEDSTFRQIIRFKRIRMKVLILEDVIEHQVRLEKNLDEISKESNIPYFI